MNFVVLISYPISKKNLRYRWSKTLGLEPPPNIVPDIEDFKFDTEVMSSISKFLISLYQAIIEKLCYQSQKLRYRSLKYAIGVPRLPSGGGGGQVYGSRKNESGPTGLGMDSQERATSVGVRPMRWIVHVWASLPVYN